jgi:hypothetical protein
MVSVEILVTQILTVLVAVVALIIGLKLFKKYKKTEVSTPIFLSIYSFCVFLTYFFVFLFRFPSPEVNLAEKTIAIPIIVYLSLGLQAFFALAFTIDMIRPYKLKWLAIPFVFLLLYLISIFLEFPIKVLVSPGIYEWITSELMDKTSIIPVVMAYIPVGFLGFYSIKMPRKEERIKGLWLLAGFFMMATFSNFFDA